MTSNLKVKMNRCNAKKSTGPKTDAGKKRSALNAVSHGLSAQSVFDAKTQKKIENLATAFADEDTDNPQVMALAREAAEAQIMVERVKEARRWAWEEAGRDISIRNRGALFILSDRCMVPHHLNDMSVPDSYTKPIMPYAHKTPFESDIEREAATLEVASRKLSKLVRFERRAINQRDRALRLLAQNEKMAHEI